MEVSLLISQSMFSYVIPQYLIVSVAASSDNEMGKLLKI